MLRACPHPLPAHQHPLSHHPAAPLPSGLPSPCRGPPHSRGHSSFSPLASSLLPDGCLALPCCPLTVSCFLSSPPDSPDTESRRPPSRWRLPGLSEHSLWCCAQGQHSDVLLERARGRQAQPAVTGGPSGGRVPACPFRQVPGLLLNDCPVAPPNWPASTTSQTAVAKPPFW